MRELKDEESDQDAWLKRAGDAGVAPPGARPGDATIAVGGGGAE